MKKLSILLLLTSLSLQADNYKDFLQESANAYNQYENNEKLSFKEYKKALEEEFSAFKKAYDEEIKNYKTALERYWEEPELPSRHTYVEYTPDKKTQKKVNYEEGYIEINVIEKDEKEARKKIAKALASLVTEDSETAYKKDPVIKKVEEKTKNFKLVKKDNVPKKPLVSDVIFNKTPTTEEVKKYVLPKLKEVKKESSKKVAKENVYKLRVALPTKAFLVKAKEMKSDVYKESVFKIEGKSYPIMPSLIYAVIHTESSFNPMARSHIPAFGLMQIVPRSAGVDAYNWMYGKKRILSASYLYNPQNNIKMGAAYLKRLYYVYLKRIDNPISRLYCAIAAYNTGAGNVAWAFRGDYNIYKASKEINKLTPDQVYDKLVADLKYKEARHYLQRVKKRMKMYRAAIKSGNL